jgi:hypothetical protein
MFMTRFNAVAATLLSACLLALGAIVLTPRATGHDTESGAAPSDAKPETAPAAGIHNDCYYVQGLVKVPGKIPFEGSVTVLDAINSAGGLVGGEAGNVWLVRLFRPAPPGDCCGQVLTVDLGAIIKKADTITNYRLTKGDTLVVSGATGLTDPDVERRISRLEGKLDLILKRLDGPAGRPRD